MPLQLKALSKFSQAYVLGVSAIGLAVAAHSLGQLFVQQVDPQWLILAALTLLTGAFTVRIPGIPARLSVSDTFVLVSVLLFGPAAGTIISLLDALIISLRVEKSMRQPFRIIFNVSAVALSTNAAAQVFFRVAGIRPYSIEPTPLGQILFPLFLCALTYFLLNSWLVTFILALEKRRPPFAIWRDNFLWLSVNYFVGGSVAGLLVTYSREIDLTTLGVILPLLVVSYLTFKTSLGRIDDANQHLTQVNKMYLSTIETLAMAIDAKDQITHGHIRRVQRLAVGLAKVVGVREDTQIKAIEAAALLHDMGKLAIPEFILNKPGKLTPNEFGVMKQHANIGADILSSIQFPYPVVPIVRHHHECWDGSGYPHGLKGVAIPLGARILSVVDCFDALTSDRPYRPKLSVAEAIEVLVQRRGSMYDPLIVDRFIEAQEELSALATIDPLDREALDSMATRLRVVPDSTLPGRSNSYVRLPIRALRILTSLKPLPQGISVEDLGAVVSRQIGKLTNVASVALYCVTENEQSISCCYADGPLSFLADGTEMLIGEKLSGWVVAHRTAIWNSDASLDLSEQLSKGESISLGSSLPLIADENVVGALTLYSAAGHEISIEQRLLIESIIPMLALAVASAMEHDTMLSIDGTASKDREMLYSVLDGLLSQHGPSGNTVNTEVPLIIRVRWTQTNERSEWSQAIVLRHLSRLRGDVGHVITLSTSEVLVVAPSAVLKSSGLLDAPTTHTESNEFRVSQILNSLQLREALGLTRLADQPQAGRPLIH